VAQRFLALLLRPVFLLLAARIFSTKLGYRPAFFADLLAAALSAGDSFFDFSPAFFLRISFLPRCFSALTAAQATDRRSAPRHLGH
jgi:hypothetical protein